MNGIVQIEQVAVLEWDLARVPPQCHNECWISYSLERRIRSEIVKGTRSPSECGDFYVIDENGQKWEVRSITSSGIYFCPKYMVGSGREFNEDGFRTRLDEISGYFVGDVTKFPKIPIWKIPELIVLDWYDRGMLGAETNVCRSKVLRLMRT